MCPTLSLPGSCVTLDERESHHLRTVLRASAGEALMLLDGQGGVAEATVDAMTGPKRRDPIICRLETVRHVPEPRPKLCLYVAPPRHKQMGQLVRQATELGIWSLQPILTERSVSRPDESSIRGWEDDAIEACKQSGNAWLPRILSPQSLPAALSLAPTAGYIGWVPDKTEAPTTGHQSTDDEIGVWIGPEGGFSEAEAQSLMAHGLCPLSVGPWTLRVETAVVAVLACLYERLS